MNVTVSEESQKAEKMQGEFTEKFNKLNKEKEKKVNAIQEDINQQSAIRLEKENRKKQLEEELARINDEIRNISSLIESKQEERQKIEEEHTKSLDKMNLESEGVVNLIRESQAVKGVKNNYSEICNVLSKSLIPISKSENDINEQKVNILNQTIKYMTSEVKCVKFIRNRLAENTANNAKLEKQLNEGKNKDSITKQLKTCKDYIKSDTETLNALLDKVNESIDIINKEIINTPV